MNAAAPIDVQDVRKVYKSGLLRRSQVAALKGVSFQVPRGEIFGLLGRNGAGKTTLIKVLLGIVRRSGGQASLFGHPAGSRAGRRQVGYLPESHRIPRHHTGNTALEYYGSLSGVSGSEIRRRRPELLDLVGLTGWEKTSVRKYSKGMQQRLGIAQALMHDPELLILDEPTDGVDPEGRAQLRAVLHRLKDAGKTIFLNSHLLQEIELVCDRVAILDHGQLMRVGAVNEIRGDNRSQVVFELMGSEAAIRAALATDTVTSLRAGEGENWLVAVSLPDQSAQDASIDRLRDAGVSISGISVDRRSLEDAFLNLIKEEQKLA